MAGPMGAALAGAREHHDFMRRMRGEVATGRRMATKDAKSLLSEHKDSVLNTAREMRASPEAFVTQMGESGAIAKDHPLARAIAVRKEGEAREPRSMNEIMEHAGMTISDRNGGMVDKVRWMAFDRAIRKGAKINGETAIAFLERSMNRAEKNGDREEATAVAGLALEADESLGISRQVERRARREARAGSAR